MRSHHLWGLPKGWGSLPTPLPPAGGADLGWPAPAAGTCPAHVLRGDTRVVPGLGSRGAPPCHPPEPAPRPRGRLSPAARPCAPPAPPRIPRTSAWRPRRAQPGRAQAQGPPSPLSPGHNPPPAAGPCPSGLLPPHPRAAHRLPPGPAGRGAGSPRPGVPGAPDAPALPPMPRPPRCGRSGRAGPAPGRGGSRGCGRRPRWSGRGHPRVRPGGAVPARSPSPVPPLRPPRVPPAASSGVTPYLV